MRYSWGLIGGLSFRMLVLTGKSMGILYNCPYCKVCSCCSTYSWTTSCKVLIRVGTLKPSSSIISITEICLISSTPFNKSMWLLSLFPSSTPSSIFFSLVWLSVLLTCGSKPRIIAWLSYTFYTYFQPHQDSFLMFISGLLPVDFFLFLTTCFAWRLICSNLLLTSHRTARLGFVLCKPHFF